jgi:hypothetical protein
MRLITQAATALNATEAPQRRSGRSNQRISTPAALGLAISLLSPFHLLLAALHVLSAVVLRGMRRPLGIGCGLLQRIGCGGLRHETSGSVKSTRRERQKWTLSLLVARLFSP